MQVLRDIKVQQDSVLRAVGLAALGLVLPLALGASTASAAPISLVNAGFETPDGANSDVVGWNDVDFGNEGWRAGTFTVPANFTAFTQPHPEGARVGYLNASSSLAQNSLHALTAGETYTLSASFGNRNNDTMRPTDMVLYADNGSGGLGDVLASAELPNQGPGGVPEGTWQELTVTFDTNDVLNSALVGANLGRNLHVFLGHSLDETGGGEVVIDHVQLSYTPVPEPAALSLLGLGALTVLRRRR